MSDEITPKPPEDEPEAAAEETRNEEEVLETPSSKYERIMMAAAEASRLNEESRRKGTKFDHKVTIEALKRVDEGKVKAVLGGKGILSAPTPPSSQSAPPETIFISRSAGDSDSDDKQESESREDSND